MSVLGGGPLVHDWLTAAAAEHGDAVALASPSRRVTFTELDAFATALAGALARRGVGAGDRVVCALDGVEGVVALFAVLRCGGILVPLAPDVALAGLLADTEAKALLVDAEGDAHFAQAAARSPKLATVVVRGAFDTSRAAGVATYVRYDAALMEHDEAPAARRIDLDPALRLRSPDAPVDLPHAALLARAATLARGIELRPGDLVVATTDPDRTALLAALGAGACTFVGPVSDAAAALPAAPEGVRLHVVARPDDDVQDAPGTIVHRVYAPAVGGPVAELTAAPGGAGSSYAALPNAELSVVGESGAPLGAGVVGDVAVRGAGVLRGAATAAGDDSALTGDQGMLDADGRLHLL